MSAAKSNCAGCPELAVDRDARGWPKRGAVGYCRLREFPIEGLEDCWCENHPDLNVLRFQAPVGPLMVEGNPVVLGGVPYREEGSGEVCAMCGAPTPGPEQIVWRKEAKRSCFCSREHYLDWAGQRDPTLRLKAEPEKEDVAEIRRLHQGLCDVEEAVQAGASEPLKPFPDLLRFTGRSLYRLLRSKKMLPRAPIDSRWSDLFRGGPPETRERINPWVLEVQFALRELQIDPPEMLPKDPSERAFEYARVRWARMVLGELVGRPEGPETPTDVDKRFRGRHRPKWREGETEVPANARRVFYIERNPDLEPELRQYFSAAQSAD